jgi:hypothetical protein
VARVQGQSRRRFGLQPGLLLAVVLGAVGWAAVVWICPGLRLGESASSRGLQSAVLIAAGSIQAAVVVFGLAVGAIVVQVMASYSWAVVRSVLPGWLAPVLAAVVGAGVILSVVGVLLAYEVAEHGCFRCFRLVVACCRRDGVGDRPAYEPDFVG